MTLSDGASSVSGLIYHRVFNDFLDWKDVKKYSIIKLGEAYFRTLSFGKQIVIIKEPFEVIDNADYIIGFPKELKLSEGLKPVIN